MYWQQTHSSIAKQETENILRLKEQLYIVGQRAKMKMKPDQAHAEILVKPFFLSVNKYIGCMVGEKIFSSQDQLFEGRSMIVT